MHILLFEPRYEGHHIMYLVGVAKAFLDLKFKVTLGLDLRTEHSINAIKKRAPSLLEKVSVCSLFDSKGKFRGKTKIEAASICLKKCGADEIFFNCFDEVASNLLRKAAFNCFPPKNLHSKISGIYLRPRPIDPEEKGLNKCLKKRGFLKLQKAGWFKNIFLMDEFLQKKNQKCFFLPDPYFSNFQISQSDAREKLSIPKDKTVFLHYGTAGKRKGLHLLLKALSQINSEKIFLICAGKQTDSAILKSIRREVNRGRAIHLNHYIFEEEETLCFCATDFVCIPYLNHYGSSGPFVRAAAAEKPILASDFQLLGKRTKAYSLGLTFKQKNTKALKQSLEAAINLDENAYRALQQNCKQYAKINSQASFQKYLLTPYK